MTGNIRAPWTDHPFASILPDGFALSRSAVDGIPVASVDHPESDLHVDMIDDARDPITPWRVTKAIEAIRRHLPHKENLHG